MHGYSTDSNERKVVPLLLALMAIALAWMSSKFLAVMHLAIPWWLDAPSSMAFYGALYALFDKYLWRNSFVYNMGLVRIPNLTGRDRKSTRLNSSHSQISYDVFCLNIKAHDSTVS